MHNARAGHVANVLSAPTELTDVRASRWRRELPVLMDRSSV